MANAEQKVLLVDDDPNFVKLYTTTFKQRGIDNAVALNGAEALEKVKTERPALILLDVMMPGMSGFEVLARLKNDQKTKDIPVWMLTNLGENFGEEKTEGMGAQEYFTKVSTSPLVISDKILQFFGAKPNY